MATVSLEKGELTYHIKGNLAWSHFAVFIIITLFSTVTNVSCICKSHLFPKVQLSTY